MRKLLPLLSAPLFACQAPPASVPPPEAPVTSAPATEPGAGPGVSPPPHQSRGERGDGSMQPPGEIETPPLDLGSGFGNRGKRPEKVQLKQSSVDGELESDVIRRIVRVHINELRWCYRRALEDDPTTTGRVELEFVIAADGNVTSSRLASSQITGTDPGRCMAETAKRWEFPKPADGQPVRVNYPIELSPPGS